MELFLQISFLVASVAGVCIVRSPKKVDSDAPTIGLIFIPGAKILGNAYLPLLEAVQDNYPGSLWVGATTGWLNDMPNPVEIGSRIDDCLVKASHEGLSTDNVFFGGHSLGGIVLETYISGHSKIAEGIALIGTWLPDLLGEKSR